MATWAIGDVHGCFATLEALLPRLELDLERDRLWLVGDLVNRGPASLATLRWARATAERMGERFVCVLGNHDLHFLARWSGVGRRKPKDTLDDLLAAPDADELAGWLLERPFLHREGDLVLVHAGLWPEWTVDQAAVAAERAAALLRNPSTRLALLAPPAPADGIAPADRRAVEALVQLRTCTPGGVGCRHSGPPGSAPAGCLPWFDVPGRGSAGATVVCGHWAALGLRLRPRLLALDSACVWGRCLTALRLEDRQVVQQPTVEAPDALPGD